MKPLTVLEIFQPLVLALQILGINFAKVDKGKLIYSKLRLTQTFVYFMICAIYTFRYWKNYTIVSIGTVTKAVTLVLICRCFGSILVMVVVLVLAYSGYTLRLHHATQQISQLDSELSDTGMTEHIYESNRQHRNIAIRLIFLVNIFSNIIVDFLTVLFYPQDLIEFFAVLVYPKLVVSIMNCIFMLYTILLQERYRMINEIIKKFFILQTTSSQKLTRVVHLHKTLTKISQEINSINGFQFLLWITFYFFLILGDLHALTFTLCFTYRPELFFIVFVVAKNVCTYVFELIYVATRCRRLCLEVSWLHLKVITRSYFLGKSGQNSSTRSSSRHPPRTRKKFRKSYFCDFLRDRITFCIRL
jgi:hypothetical protein